MAHQPDTDANQHFIFPMTLGWYHDVYQISVGNLPCYENDPGHWRRAAVADLYFGLRSQGDDHEEALFDLLVALPLLELDEEGYPDLPG